LYDAAGQLTSYNAGGTAKTLGWDGDGRSSSTTGGTAVGAFYDGHGSRLKKVVGSVTTRYPNGDNYEVSGTTTTKYITVEGRLVAKSVTSSGPPLGLVAAYSFN